jgi:hypothetical protein
MAVRHIHWHCAQAGAYCGQDKPINCRALHAMARRVSIRPVLVRRSARRTPRPKIIVNAFLTLDGVMRAPGGPDEDPERG